MKKAILLIAVLLLVGSLSFAEGTFGIWGRTRFALAEGNNTLTLAQTYQDWSLWGNNGPQMQLNWSWSSDKMGYTLKYVLSGDHGAIGTTTFNGPFPITITNGVHGNNDWRVGGAVAKAYGTLKLVPSLLTLHIGYMQDYDQFRYEGGASAWTFNTQECGRLNGWGLIAVLAPKDSGFVLAAQWRTELGNTLIVDANLSNISIGVEYQMPDIFKVQAALVRAGQAWRGDAVTYPVVDGNPEYGAYNILVRLHLLAVPGLTLNITNNMAGLLEPETSFNNTRIRDTLYARYGIEAFAVALGAESLIVMQKAAGLNTTVDLDAFIEPSYNLGPITVGLGVRMDIPTVWSVGTSPDDSLTLEFQPWITITDFATRIFFNFTMNADNVAATSDYTWALKADVTLSF